MVFKRFVEVGRVVLIKNGAFSSKIAVIVEILDHNRVLIDGPQAITGVPRQVINLNNVSLTQFVVAHVTKGMTHQKLCLRFVKQNIMKRFNNTNAGKAIHRRELRQNMTDFDKFQVNLINRKINATARIAAATALKKY